MPTTFHFCKNFIDGSGCDVTTQHTVQAVAFLLDHAHPQPHGLLALCRQAVYAAALPGARFLCRRPDQAVCFELSESPIDTRPIDATELQCVDAFRQAVAVAWLLGQQQENRGRRKWRGAATSNRECRLVCQLTAVASSSIIADPRCLCSTDAVAVPRRTLPIFRSHLCQGDRRPASSLGSRCARAFDLHCDRQDCPSGRCRSAGRTRSSRHRPSPPGRARHASPQLGDGGLRHTTRQRSPGGPRGRRRDRVPNVREPDNARDPIFRCGVCGSADTFVVSGNELLVTSLDLTVDAI